MKKFFKGLGIVIIILVVVYLILCLVGSKEMKVTRSITINAQPEMIMPLLGDLKFFQEKWSPWTERDPNMKVNYEGTPNTVGHKISWSGNDEVKTGSLSIDSILPNKIVQTLSFGEGMESTTWFEVVPEGEGSKVTWGMWGETPFIWRGMTVFMNMEKMIGEDYDKGLANMKKVIEEMAAAQQPAYTVSETDWSEKLYVGKRSTETFENLEAFFGTNFSAIYSDAQKNKVELAGPPVGIFYTFDEKERKTDLAAAFPVKPGTKDLKGWEKFPVPAGKALVVDYYGSYKETKSAHMVIDKYMKEKNISQSLVIEEYVTDPGVEKDTAKWLTKIYYILK